LELEKELDKNIDSVSTILCKARQGSITLLYGAKEERFNNAVALKEYLEERNNTRKDSQQVR
jgi:uncharacterized protein YeaO (DUF488 family)